MLDEDTPVLVLEVNAHVRSFLARSLAFEGLAVLAAATAAEALALLRGAPRPVAALVAGELAPELPLLRREAPGLRVCVMTGGGVADGPLLALGVQAVVRKPFGAGEPAATLRRLLAG